MSVDKSVLVVKVKYHDDELALMHKIPCGDWIDLRAAHDTFIEVGTSKMISLGVSMQLPEGYEAHVLPRSSTFKNFGIILVNGMGIIDNSYCGDNDIWRFPAFSLVATHYENGKRGSKICKNDRIAQFRIVKKQPNFYLEIVEELGNENRGGFGSTGINHILTEGK